MRRYKKNSPITIRVELTANHRGYFEFRICPNNALRRAGTQACLDKYVLRRAKFAELSDEQNHETRYYPAAGNKASKKSTITYSSMSLALTVKRSTPYSKIHPLNFKSYTSHILSSCIYMFNSIWYTLIAATVTTTHSNPFVFVSKIFHNTMM